MTKPTTLPTGWKQINLGEECDFERGFEPGADAYNTEGIGQRFIRVVDVTESRDNPIYVDVPTTKRVKKEDILFTLDGTIGAITRGLAGVYSTGVRKVSFRNDYFSDDFLYYLLQGNEVQRIINIYASGSTIRHASAAISYLKVGVPSEKNEQEKIAKVISSADVAIANTQRVLAKLVALKRGFVADLFSTGISEDGKPRSKKSHAFKSTRYGLIPNEWELTQLVNVAKISDGTHQGVSFVNEGIPFLFVSCVRNGEISWDTASKISPAFYKSISRGKEPTKGMILYTVVGSYGHAALVADERPFAFQRHIACLFPQSNIVPEFLEHWLNAHIAKSYAETVALGNAQKTITLGDLGTFPVFLPKKEEQERIAQALTKISKLITEECTLLNKLEKQRTGLMQDLLTGTVRIATLAGK